MQLSTLLSILASVIAVSTFVLNRKDKAIKDTKESDEESSNQRLIDYRLTQVEKKLDKILDILDSYDKEIDIRIEKSMEQHIKLYHGGN
jgi:hypothetical protein